MFVIVWAASDAAGRTLTGNEREAPAASVPTPQVTFDPAAVQPLGSVVTPSPGARSSVTVTPVASAEPWFATPRRKVTSLPTSTVVELAVLLATRSGCPEGREGAEAAGGGDGWFVTATAAVAALLDPSGSDVVELAEGVFVSVRPAAALV